MDPILTTADILQDTNWVFFKIYRNPSARIDWKSNLDWYHQVLIEIVRPLVQTMPEIRAVFFGLYGPTRYAPDGEDFEKQITPPSTDVVFIRLRISVNQKNKTNVKNAFVQAFNAKRNLVWDYEIMTTYHVRNDLGKRYGSSNDDQTLRFIRYWDSACRYILSILALPGNWIQNVDVWGIPHLVNNSLGAFLRVPTSRCPCCHEFQYLVTGVAPIRKLPPHLQAMFPYSKGVPVFLAFCPKCRAPWLITTNI